MTAIAHEQPDVMRGLRFLAGRVLPLVLWVTIACGALAFIEPSPYEFAFLVLTLVVAVRGMAVPRAILVPLIFLTVFNLGGLISLSTTEPEFEAQKFVAVSAYLGLTTIIAALVVAEDPRRMNVVATAYIAAALLTAVAGILGYFDVAGLGDLFSQNARARGTFKDPNVMAPFLVMPALLLAHGILRGSLPKVIFCAGLLAPILIAILLSFSRGAWGHTLVSFALFGWLLFVTSPSQGARVRILLSAVGAIVAAALVLGALLSVPKVAELFEVRAKLVQNYDGGAMGRFGKLTVAIPELTSRPNGFGPLQFRDYFREEPHNVYVNAFASYGWLGGFAYLGFVATTLAAGLMTALRRSPYQHYAIAAFATFSVLCMEGFVIDTDHWRHFYLLAALIWGLFAAARSAIGPASLSLPEAKRANSLR
ncbi:O-antigen ligase family protein [Tepidamorphus sp. 3E244]|uniref:O-antigen ligase family protein n=1 Tax=Tepidamorphus sp. 3E244 TaxID=3385498 RepID=UPI0038FC63A1